jgi:hypothetical protein
VKRLRLTVAYEFDYTGNINQAAIDRLVENFLKDPTNFLGLDRMAWDETIYVDIEDITNEQTQD